MGWVTRAPMPTARYGLTAGVVTDILYAVGGVDTAWTAVNEAYDPSTDTWESRAAMPTARYELAAGVVDGILYAVGGWTGATSAVNESYDPSTDTWASRAAMPTARDQLAAGVVDDILYAVGGSTGSAIAVNERYDPSTNTWSSRAPMPTARDSPAAGVINGVLYAVGGNDGSWLAINEAYNPSTNTWAARADMPTARYGLTAGVVTDILYAVGGYDGSWLAINEAYDPATNTWSTRASMPTARRRLAAGVVDGILYAVGGADASFQRTDVNEAYTPTGTVTGTVRDAATLSPLAGVSVTSDDGQATTTESDGSYTLEDVGAGARQVTFSLAGYHAQAKPVTVTSGGVEIVNVDLVPAIVDQADSDSGAVTISETPALQASPQATDSGTATATEGEPAVTASLHVSDAGTITVTETARVMIIERRVAADSAIVTISETHALRITEHKDSTDAGTVTAEEAERLAADLRDTDTADAAITETVARTAADPRDADGGAVVVSETPAVRASLGTQHDAGDVSITETETVAVDLTNTDAGTVTISETHRLRIVGVVHEPRLALDVYDAAGNRLGAGPITELLHAEYTLKLDEIGSWSVRVPATTRGADLLTPGHEVRLRREGEGLLYRGIVDRAVVTVGASGERTLEVTGLSLATQLLWANTLLGREFAGVPVATAATNLLAGTGWSLGSVGSGPTVSTRFDGASIWAALRAIAQTYGWHLREDNLTRRVDLEEAGAPSGLVLTQVEQARADLAVVPLTGLTIREEQAELWNRIIPLGAGEGINALTLEQAERSAPYTIKEGTGPDGQPYWYLEDAASIAAHGARTRVLKIEDAAPISNSEAEIVAAANALYDVAAAWLAWHAHPAEFYGAEVVGLTHLDPATGLPRFQVGQTARLQWRGIVADKRGRRLWRAVDHDVYLMGVRREFADSGADRWQLELATIDQHAPGAADGIVKAIEDLWAVQTALKPYTYREVHGPQRQSLDSANPVRFVVDFDDNVTYLHSARLQLSKLRLRANARTAAAGGGATSSGGSAHSHSVSGQTAQSGGGATSSAGAAHSHTIGGTTTQSDGAPHGHPIGQMLGAVEPWTDPAYKQVLVFDDAQGNAFGVWVGRETTNQPVGSFWTRGYTTHTHGISGMATQTEASHTHQTPNHTHAVSGTTTSADTSHTHQVPAHTHPLEYGIYEGPTASTPQFHIWINGVDRTSELGGPWNGDVTLDITRYLVDSRGLLVRRQNVIEIRGSQLTDVELTCKSLVSSTALVPV